MTKPENINVPPVRVVRATLAVAAVLVVFYLVYYFREVLLVLLLAIILATALRPLVGMLNEKIPSRSRAVMLVYAALLIAIIAVLALAVPLLVEEISNLIDELPGLYEDLRLWLMRSSERGFAYLANELPSSETLIPSLGDRSTGSNGVSTSILSAGRTIFRALIGILAVILLAAFWSLEGRNFIGAIEDRLNESRRAKFQRLVREFNSNIGQFVRAQAMLSLSVGVLSFVAYLIIGLPNPFALAVIAGILEAVPIVGPTLGAIPAALVAFPMGTGKLIGVVAAAMVIQLLENNLLVPRVMNESVGVHPILTLLSLVTLTGLLGIPGGILAIPFASAVQVIFREIRENADPPPAVTIETRADEGFQAESLELIEDVRAALPGSPRGEDVSLGYDLERALLRLLRYIREHPEVESRK